MTTKDTTTNRTAFALQLLALAGMTSGLAYAGPEGGDVTSGSGNIDVDGNVTTVTTGANTIIDWTSFDIAGDETVIFDMLNSSSRVLNRVNSMAPSQIDGTLTANGHVYIVNPSGVIFGESSVINVGSLTAAAGNLSNADFMAGNDHFTGLSGHVENQGAITGELVQLVGATVANIGSISAPDGTVVMAAGEDILIGSLLGHRYVQINRATTESLPQDHAGASDLAAGDVFSIAAFHSGSIDAKDAMVVAGGGTTRVSGSIAATGVDGGVVVAGKNVVVDSVSADALERGGALISGPSVTISAASGGSINLGADVQATATDLTLNGDTMLTDDVSLSTSGFQGKVIANGDIYSQAERYFDLSVFSNGGIIEFNGALGEGSAAGNPVFTPAMPLLTVNRTPSTERGRVGFDYKKIGVRPFGPPEGDVRLGKLTVESPLALFEGNVMTYMGMNIFAEAGVTGESVTFHTGIGDSLFADHVYAAERGNADVAFMYDDDVSTGVGTQRVPFSFRKNIGTPPVVRLIPNSGAFRNITLGSDTGDFLTSASFFFSNAASGDGMLADASMIDTSIEHFITATESIMVGRGQKITALGSIQLAAKGNGATHVQVSDVNALGDITILSRGRAGGTIALQSHLGGLIDGVENEADRANGGLEEETAQLIASGAIEIDGMLLPDSAGATLGASNVILANNSGTGSTMGLPIIQIVDSPVSINDFLGTQMGSQGGAYAYDLTLGDFVDLTPPGPGPTASTANLAEGLASENTLQIRDDDPYLAQRDVLRELGLNPVDPAAETHREAARDGLETYVSSINSRQALTIDRLSRRAVNRFVSSYVELLGAPSQDEERVDKIVSLREALSSGGPESSEAFADLRELLNELDLLELTPLEKSRARSRLFAILGLDEQAVTTAMSMK